MKTYRVVSLVPDDGIEHEFKPEDQDRGPFTFTVRGQIKDAIVVYYDESEFHDMSPMMMLSYFREVIGQIKEKTGVEDVLILGDGIELVRLVEVECDHHDVDYLPRAPDDGPAPNGWCKRCGALLKWRRGTDDFGVSELTHEWVLPGAS